MSEFPVGEQLPFPILSVTHSISQKCHTSRTYNRVSEQRLRD